MGALDWFASPLLGQRDLVRGAQARLLPLACGLSGFLNNTPLVAMFIPVVKDLSKRTYSRVETVASAFLRDDIRRDLHDHRHQHEPGG